MNMPVIYFGGGADSFIDDFDSLELSAEFNAESFRQSKKGINACLAWNSLCSYGTNDMSKSLAEKMENGGYERAIGSICAYLRKRHFFLFDVQRINAAPYWSINPLRGKTYSQNLLLGLKARGEKTALAEAKAFLSEYIAAEQQDRGIEGYTVKGSLA